MNRILFVGLCLIGIVAFVLISKSSDLKKQSETKIVKHIETDSSHLH